MTTEIKRRRGTTAQHATFVGGLAEITIDTDKKTIVVHDGVTAGGFPLARADDIPEIPEIPDTPAPAPPSPQGRLSLVPGTASPESDVVGATTVHYVPCAGAAVPVLDGTDFVRCSIGAGLSLVLDGNAAHTAYHQVGMIYDLFAFMDGTILRLGTGPSWNSGAVSGSSAIGVSIRGTGAGSTELERHLGHVVNKNAIALRCGSGAGEIVGSVPARAATYLGSFAATADGQATDTKAKRLLFNAHCCVVRPMRFVTATNGYSYASSAWRQSEGLVSYQIEFLLGLAGIAVSAENTEAAVVSGSGANFVTGIGLNGSAAPSVDCAQGFNAVAPGGVVSATARYRGFPGLGRHALKAMEQGFAGITFYNGGCGIYGEFLG